MVWSTFKTMTFGNGQQKNLWTLETEEEEDLQGLNPSERDVERSDDDKISFHVKISQRSDQDSSRHIELVVPWRSHVHHRCVGVLMLRPPRFQTPILYRHQSVFSVYRRFLRLKQLSLSICCRFDYQNG